MSPRKKFINTINCSNYDIPVFCPAIYDYKVNFSNAQVHEFGQDKDEFINAVKKEIRALNSEIVTCGYDIYNVEAEALGSKIMRDKANIFPEVLKPLIYHLDDICKLPVFTELKGRMPLYIDITKTLKDQFKDEVYFRGAVSGPFSLAGRIYDKEKLILDTILNPQGVTRLLEYCTEVILTYIRGYLEKKLDVVVFDSLASPPLVSPEIYRDLIFPFHKIIYNFLKNEGVEIRPLIMGGNTLPILEFLSGTGANQLLLDYNIPLGEMEKVIKKYKLAFRINIDPDLIARSNLVQLGNHLRKVNEIIGHKTNLLIGTGILMKDVPLENIQYIRDFLNREYKTVPIKSA